MIINYTPPSANLLGIFEHEDNLFKQFILDRCSPKSLIILQLTSKIFNRFIAEKIPELNKIKLILCFLKYIRPIAFDNVLDNQILKRVIKIYKKIDLLIARDFLNIACAALPGQIYVINKENRKIEAREHLDSVLKEISNMESASEEEKRKREDCEYRIKDSNIIKMYMAIAYSEIAVDQSLVNNRNAYKLFFLAFSACHQIKDILMQCRVLKTIMDNIDQSQIPISFIMTLPKASQQANSFHIDAIDALPFAEINEIECASKFLALVSRAELQFYYSPRSEVIETLSEVYRLIQKNNVPSNELCFNKADYFEQLRSVVQSNPSICLKAAKEIKLCKLRKRVIFDILTLLAEKDPKKALEMAYQHLNIEKDDDPIILHVARCASENHLEFFECVLDLFFKIYDEYPSISNLDNLFSMVELQLNSHPEEAKRTFDKLLLISKGFPFASHQFAKIAFLQSKLHLEKKALHNLTKAFKAAMRIDAKEILKFITLIQNDSKQFNYGEILKKIIVRLNNFPYIKARTL